MTLGGEANPPAWIAISETLCELLNDIPLICEWDPGKIANANHNPSVKPKYLTISVPIQEAEPISYKFHISDTNCTSHLGMNNYNLDGCKICYTDLDGCNICYAGPSLVYLLLEFVSITDNLFRYAPAYWPYESIHGY